MPSGKNRQKTFGTQNTVPFCQKCTPTDCFFGDFATTGNGIIIIILHVYLTSESNDLIVPKKTSYILREYNYENKHVSV